MRRNGYTGRTVALTLRYTDFTTFTRRTTVETCTNSGLDIHQIAMDVLNAIRLQHPVRLVGVSVSNLTRNVAQIPLLPKTGINRPPCALWTRSTTGTGISILPGNVDREVPPQGRYLPFLAAGRR